MKTLQPKAKMTRAQRRKALEVARDVLLQLRLGKIRSECGSGYLMFKGTLCPRETTAMALDPEGSFQETFQGDKSLVCNVCAIGAVYISYINRFNQVKNRDVALAQVETMLATLSTVWSQDQLKLMEAVFESGFVNYQPEWYWRLDSENYLSSEKGKIDDIILSFYDRYPDREARLRVIMLNVIRNDGEFRLPNRIRQPN